MKLLLFSTDDNDEQVLMIVPDEWNEEFAQLQAEVCLEGKVYLADTYDVNDKWIGERTGEYRPYVG